MKRHSTITQQQLSLRAPIFRIWGNLEWSMVAAVRSLFAGFVNFIGGSINTLVLSDFGKLAPCSDMFAKAHLSGLTLPTQTGGFSSYLNSLEPKQPLRSGWCDLTYSEAPT